MGERGEEGEGGRGRGEREGGGREGGREGEEEEVRKWELSEEDRTYSSDSGEFFFVNFLLVLQIL